MAGSAALSLSDSDQQDTLRPVFVDEKNAESLAKQAPPLAKSRRRSRRSITAGARWIPTCVPEHPFALLRDVSILKSTFPVNFDKNGRNLAQMYRHCGGTLGWIPKEHRKDKVLAHQLSEDRSRCTIEILGSEDATRENDENDHVLRVMRSRVRDGKLEFRSLTYRVPEQDWPYLAKVVRESAESYEAVFE